MIAVVHTIGYTQTLGHHKMQKTEQIGRITELLEIKTFFGRFANTEYVTVHCLV